MLARFQALPPVVRGMLLMVVTTICFTAMHTMARDDGRSVAALRGRVLPQPVRPARAGACLYAPRGRAPENGEAAPPRAERRGAGGLDAGLLYRTHHDPARRRDGARVFRTAVRQSTGRDPAGRGHPHAQGCGAGCGLRRGAGGAASGLRGGQRRRPADRRRLGRLGLDDHDHQGAGEDRIERDANGLYVPVPHPDYPRAGALRLGVAGARSLSLAYRHRHFRALSATSPSRRPSSSPIRLPSCRSTSCGSSGRA